MSDTVPAIILVRPQMGENIGAAARAMWNFGLDHMRVVAPRDGWPSERAVAMASGAGRVLDNAMLTDEVQGATGDLTHVYATTARVRGLAKPVYTPREAMVDARRRQVGGERIGVLFGPERAGLENDDLALANTLISVPVNPGFASLNLAQCVLLVAYEWMQTNPPDLAAPDLGRMATRDEIERLYGRLDAGLTEAGFFWPDHKAAHMRLTLRALIGRLDLTEPDVRMLHGIVKALGRERKAP